MTRDASEAGFRCARAQSEKIASDETPIISGLYIHREEIGPYPPKKLKMTLEHI